jgi:hypothetical protein
VNELCLLRAAVLQFTVHVLDTLGVILYSVFVYCCQSTMGSCCSCCTDADEEAAATRETEMAAHQSAKSLVISPKMSAPTVKIMEGNVALTGHGLALVATALEQDAAYWEWHVSLPARKHVDTILFGVTSQKDQQFYREQQGKKEPEEGA